MTTSGDKIKTVVKNVSDGKNSKKYMGILFAMSEDPANREEIVLLSNLQNFLTPF